MKNALNGKTNIPHTYYLLQIKITAYKIEINSSTISEATCPSGNVTSPYAAPAAAFCTFVQCMDLRILLPCNCHVTHLCLHLTTKTRPSSTAQYRDHLFGLLKYFSNGFWLLCNASLTGDNNREVRDLRGEGDRSSRGGSRCLRSILLFLPVWSLLVPFTPWRLSLMTATSRVKFYF